MVVGGSDEARAGATGEEARVDDDVARREELDRAAAGRDRSALGQVWRFAMANKKWWMAPIIIVLLLVGVLVVVSSTGAGPLLYTLF